MDMATVDDYLLQAKNASILRRVPVSRKHLQEFCKVYKEHIADVGKKVEADDATLQSALEKIMKKAVMATPATPDTVAIYNIASKALEHHIVDVNKKVNVSSWEETQVNMFTRVETMG